MSFINNTIQTAKNIAYQIHNSHPKYIKCPNDLLKWIGVDNIFVSKTHNLEQVLDKYTTIKGDCNMLKIINDFTISYKDHVSRIKTNNGLLPEAIYTFPNISNSKANVYDIIKIPKYITKTAFQTIENNKNTILTEYPKPFSYNEMEKGKCLTPPLSLGYPDFLFNIKHLPKFESVLHLPIKINMDCEVKFRKEGRVDCNGEKILCSKIYLPKELSSLGEYIQYLAQIELKSNPYFFCNYYLFLSISDSEVLPNDTHRRGGWHIDGHQGYERLINSNVKQLTDRQYILCDVLPTEFYPMKFDFNEIRKKHNLDSVNMQDIIEKMVSKQELLKPELISTIKTNEINFLTPYMVHRGQTNKTDKPIKRKFIRLICSPYSRDRIGDTINPIIGPLNPMKIKTITDIYEI